MYCCLTKLLNNLLLWSGWTLLVIFGFLILAILWSLLSKPINPVIRINPRERLYHDPNTAESHPLPQLGTILQSKPTIFYADLQPATIYLSVVIPAYNEEQRMPAMLTEAIDYLEQRRVRYEIIVVDDGSTDQTTEVAMNFVRRWGADKIHVITLLKNRGKGGAIRIGVLASRGELLLFADADGASHFPDVAKLEAYIFDHLGSKVIPKLPPRGEPFDASRFPIAIGSRSHLEKDSIAKRSLFRTILMYGFHFVVWLLTVRTVRDTQCGFKLFPRTIAHILFTHMHVERWAFDVELLMLAEHLRVPIGEVAIRWQEIDGSKLVPFFSWLQMGKDVALIGCRYAAGTYQYAKPPFNVIGPLCCGKKQN